MKENDQSYYQGYLAAILNIGREIEEDAWGEYVVLADKLTRQVIIDVLREASIERGK